MGRKTCLTSALPGNWLPQRVAVAWTGNTRKIVPEVRARPSTTLRTAAATRLGDKLFDGPDVPPAKMVGDARPTALYASRTSATALPRQWNLYNAHSKLTRTVAKSWPIQSASAPRLADEHDGYLLLGFVATIQSRTIPAASTPSPGALEPADPLDVFAEIRRRAPRGASISPPADVKTFVASAVEDRSLCQPELSSSPRRRAKAELERQLDHTDTSPST